MAGRNPQKEAQRRRARGKKEPDGKEHVRVFHFRADDRVAEERYVIEVIEWAETYGVGLRELITHAFHHTAWGDQAPVPPKSSTQMTDRHLRRMIQEVSGFLEEFREMKANGYFMQGPPVGYQNYQGYPGYPEYDDQQGENEPKRRRKRQGEVLSETLKQNIANIVSDERSFDDD